MERDVNKTNVNLSSAEVDQLPKSDGKISDSATVVIHCWQGEKEYCYRLCKLLCVAKME